jgi:putative membrane protein
MVIGVVGSARLIDSLLERFPTATMFVFIGLLVGTIPSVLRLHDDLRPTLPRVLALLLGIAVVAGVRTLETSLVGRDANYTMTTLPQIAYHSLISFLAGCASVTPGLDGSTVLLLGGTYRTVLEAVSALGDMDVRWAVLVPVAIFAGGGGVVFSKVIDTLLKRGRGVVYYAILGLVLGSIYGLYTRTTPGESRAWVLALCLLAGAATAYALGRVSQRLPAVVPASTLEGSGSLT